MKRLYDLLNSLVERALILIFGLMTLDVVWQVFSRYVVGQSSSFTEEFARFAMIWLSILGAAYLNGQRQHLAIDFLLRKLPEEKRRHRQRNIELFMALFAVVVMIIGGGSLVFMTLQLGQYSAALNVPLGVVYAIVPISGLLILFYSIYHITQREGDDVQQPLEM